MVHHARLITVLSLVGLVSVVGLAVGIDRLLTGVKNDWSRAATTIQVNADRDRTLSPVFDEMRLVDEMVSAPSVQAWALDPDDPTLTVDAIAYLNEFRGSLEDGSYFVALAGNGGYYHNNRDGDYTGTELRYTLERDHPEDAWFWATLEQKKPFNLNVDYDRGLGVVKLWINRVVMANGQPVGVAGTGFDLKQFLQRYVEKQRSSFETLFTNAAGAIQLSPHAWDIQFGSVGTVDAGDASIFERVATAADSEALNALFNKALGAPGEVFADGVSFDSGPTVVGVAYIPGIDWFEITKIPESDIIRPEWALEMYLLGGLTLLVALGLGFAVLRTDVLQPLQRLVSIAFDASDTLPSDASADLRGNYRLVAERLLELKRQNVGLQHDVHALKNQSSEAAAIDNMLLNEEQFVKQIDSYCAMLSRAPMSVAVIVITPMPPFDNDGELFKLHPDVLPGQIADAVADLALDSMEWAAYLGNMDYGVVMMCADEAEAQSEAERLKVALGRIRVDLPGGLGLANLRVLTAVEVASNYRQAKPRRLLRRAQDQLAALVEQAAG